MRISDWSSDVCSSDLRLVARRSRVVQPDHVVARTGVDNIVAAAGLEDVSESGTSEGIVAVGTDHGSAILREDDYCYDRKSVVKGKRVSGSVGLGGARTINNNRTITIANT